MTEFVACIPRWHLWKHRGEFTRVRAVVGTRRHIVRHSLASCSAEYRTPPPVASVCDDVQATNTPSQKSVWQMTYKGANLGESTFMMKYERQLIYNQKQVREMIHQMLVGIMVDHYWSLPWLVFRDQQTVPPGSPQTSQKRRASSTEPQRRREYPAQTSQHLSVHPSHEQKVRYRVSAERDMTQTETDKKNIQTKLT